jgi:hypothetical protein
VISGDSADLLSVRIGTVADDFSVMKTPGLPVFVWIIEAMDHERYDQLFGYRRRR